MNEEWRKIEGFPPHYQVSNLGQVRGKKGLMKPNKRDRVILYTYGNKLASISVPMLVAMAFVDGRTKRHPYVRHIDGNPENNRADNLEWGSCRVAAKPVEVWKDGAMIALYKSTNETAKRLGTSSTVVSYACCHSGKMQKFPGLYIRYAPTEEECAN